VASEKSGFLEEKIFDSPMRWNLLYKSIRTMTLRDIEESAKSMLGPFPNTYAFTKRMAEHLLIENNTHQLPLFILRPSIIAAALDEPVPGWTDSIGLMGGIYLLFGLGIMKDLPADENSIGD